MPSILLIMRFSFLIWHLMWDWGGGVVLNWFKSFLTNRRFVVKTRSFLLDPRQPNLWSSSGSILSPALFSLYLFLWALFSENTASLFTVMPMILQIYLPLTKKTNFALILLLLVLLMSNHGFLKNFLFLNPDKTEVMFSVLLNMGQIFNPTLELKFLYLSPCSESGCGV